jgi:pimeloyl-ACP methyl ester carboxylesterase
MAFEWRAGTVHLVRFISFVMLLTAAAGCATTNTASEGSGRPGGETVVLLHGLARTSRSMKRMEKALTDAGYAVHSLRYSSTRKTVQQASDEDLAPLIERCKAAKPARIHFVAHSLGNIILRQYFATNTLECAGRIVMLAPPNQGSEIVDKLGGLALYQWINGPAGQQLGTVSNALPQTLPVPPLEVGVIAGTRSINLILSALIPGVDDGKVAVERTKLAGMADFAAVDTAHPFIMKNKAVIALTLSFLRDGSFGARGTSRMPPGEARNGPGPQL